MPGSAAEGASDDGSVRSRPARHESGSGDRRPPSLTLAGSEGVRSMEVVERAMTTQRLDLTELRARRARLLEIAARHGARRVRVFGSVARGAADERSDVDLLVEMEPGRSLLDLGALLVELEAELGRPVDLVTEEGLATRLGERVLAEAVPL